MRDGEPGVNRRARSVIQLMEVMNRAEMLTPIQARRPESGTWFRDIHEHPQSKTEKRFLQSE